MPKLEFDGRIYSIPDSLEEEFRIWVKWMSERPFWKILASPFEDFAEEPNAGRPGGT